MRYVVACISGPDKNTSPTSFQNVVLHYPMILNTQSETNIHDISELYQRNTKLNKIEFSSDAIFVAALRDNIKITNSQLISSLGNEFTYEKILYMACLPNSIFTGRIGIYTSNDNIPLDNVKLPCVSTEHTTYEWIATLDI